MRSPYLGILLLNMGGPETLNEVFPFLYRLFRDPDIVPLPRPLRFFTPFLAFLIALLRAKKSKEGYARIGGGSPQRRTCEELARKLEGTLNRKGIPARVQVAMRYWKPSTEEALRCLIEEGCNAFVLLPLYPQYSTTTTMSSFREFWRIYKRFKLSYPVYPILHYSRDPRYQRLVVKRLLTTMRKVRNPREKTAILFSAHSIPSDRVRDLGDPYPVEVAAMIRDLEAHLPQGYRFALGYQSKLGPVPWLEPSTEETIRRLSEEGVKALVVVPISFTSEHIETLDEIAIGYRHLAMTLGIEEFYLVPTVQADEDFVEFLATLVEEIRKGETTFPLCLRNPPPERCICIPPSLKESMTLFAAKNDVGSRRIEAVLPQKGL